MKTRDRRRPHVGPGREIADGIRGVRFGGWVALSSLVVVESMAKGGFDFVALDLQHGTTDTRSALDAVHLLDVLGIDAYVRLSIADLGALPRLLDHGASGVIVASIRSVEDVVRAVAVSRYQPAGTRSYGGQRFGLRAEPKRIQDVRPEVFAMIETEAAAADLGAIAHSPGLSGLFVGPADLAVAFGLEPDDGPRNPRWLRVMDDVLEECRSAGIVSGMFAHDGADAARWAAAGFRMIAISSDIGLLRSAIASELGAARGRPTARARTAI